MVQVDERAARRRGPALGKLSSDPAVRSAAVALLLGIDPLEYLGQAPADFEITTAVIAEAHRLRVEEAKQHADYLSARTAGLTAQAITRWLGKNIPRMFRG